MFPKAAWPLSEKEFSFAESLIADLGPLGYSLTMEGNVLVFKQRMPSSTDAYRRFYRAAHTKVHSDLLRPDLEKLISFEENFGADVFIEGDSLDLSKIDPHLRPVNLRALDASPRDKAIVDYLRAYQTVGSRMSVGKENVYILEDRGHAKVPTMGVLVLASPRYYQARRDEVLGWLMPSQTRNLKQMEQERHKAIRHSGLDRMMHIAICCALPPYSELGTARLLAMAPFTKIVREDFEERWKKATRTDSDLAIVTTTTSMGTTGVPFQALRRGKFVDEINAQLLGDNWNKPGNLYSRLGDTHPWRRDRPIKTAEIFASFGQLMTAETYNRAKALVGTTNEFSELSDLKALDRAMRHIGLNRRIFRGNPIGVFIGALDRQSIEAVASGEPRTKRPVLDWDVAVRQFRSDFGEAVDPTKKPGVKTDERAAGITKRRERAVKVKLEKILLSRILLAESRGELTIDEASTD